MTSKTPSIFSFAAFRWKALAPVLGLLLAVGCQRPRPVPVLPGTAFIQVGREIAEAKDLASTLRPYRAELEARFSRILAQSPTGLDRSRPAVPLGQWITDEMRKQATHLLGSEVQVAVTNNGGLRVDVPPGPVTLRHIYEIFPFENTLVVGELKGTELQRFALELAQTGEPFSGLSIRVSGTQDDPHLDVLTLTDGTRLDPDQTYLIATTEYLVASGDKTPTLKTLRNVKSLSLTLRQVAIDAVEALGQKGLPLMQAPEVRLSRPSGWINRRTTGQQGGH